MRRSALALLIAVLASAVALHGWGREGHRIVADLAQERLTEVTKRNVRLLVSALDTFGLKALDPIANALWQFAEYISPVTNGSILTSAFRKQILS